ncbi:MAG: cytochrome c oxidase subunit I [Chloroflexota bacterium]|nr:cytochrome c oxidase subunit I [Chloroflexota bacterium]
MASIVYPQPQAGAQAPVIARPRPRTTGLWSWLTTVDHKRIGILYGVSAFVFFLIGGLEALIIRTQLIRPENDLVSLQKYNELFTMHGTTMIFLAVMPLGSAFFNYIVPLQIGARDVAFPRLNAFSFWTFLAGGGILSFSWLANAAPDGGWYGYAPLTTRFFAPGDNIDYWALGLQVLGIASLAASFNFIVTIFNMRAPGMTMMRMPMFTWNTLIVSFLIVMAFPAITIALALLSFDRFAGTNFYSAFNVDPDGNIISAAGGDPLLWQHLFWVFGHPEVYILILPAFGIISEVIPVFSRKPLFGYAVMVYATSAIAFLGFGVWVHHMFTTGLGPTPDAVFAGSTMLIAIPTGVKILNWTATMWGGSLQFTTAMLFAVGLISQFTIGGLSGVMHAVVPVDTHHQDTYFVVAHFHYVLFGGSIFALFAGIYYWWPKITGRLLDERLGKLHFWVQFVGFNMAFFPMHFLGLQGMPRRYGSYGRESGWWLWNAVSSVGAYLIGAAILLFLINVARTLANGKRADANPWDAATPEWAIPSPPPVYNFREIPIIRHRDPLWVEKYGAESHRDETEVDVTIGGVSLGTTEAPDEAPAEQVEQRLQAEDQHDIHLPNPSYYPLLASVGIFFAAMGLLVENPRIPIGALDLPSMSAVGLLLLVTGIYGWSFEPAG